MIAVKLIGRIGNQLFIYAIAEAIRQRRGRNEKIVFYDKEILDCKWKNSLEDYDLPNVEYRHDFSNVDRITRKQMAVASLERSKSFNKEYYATKFFDSISTQTYPE